MVFLQPAAPLYANENQIVSLDFGKRLFSDITALPKQPLGFSKTEWLIAGGLIAGTAGALTQDKAIKEDFSRASGDFWDSMSANFTHVGDYRYQAPFILGAWLAGTVSGCETLNKVAADGAEASLFAAGIVNPIITRITGRNLPNRNEDPYKFEPFTSHRYSFPSGHTTEAFAMAAVIDTDFRQQFGYWHTPIVYGIATATGISRIYDRKHYLSEVVLGAGIGWSIGKWIADKPRNPAAPSISASVENPGLALSWNF